MSEEQGAELESWSGLLALHHNSKRPHHERMHWPIWPAFCSVAYCRGLNPVHHESQLSSRPACPAGRYLIAYLCLIGVVVCGGRRPRSQVIGADYGLRAAERDVVVRGGKLLT